jgi:hypothetical protein
MVLPVFGRFGRMALLLMGGFCLSLVARSVKSCG